MYTCLTFIHTLPIFHEAQCNFLYKHSDSVSRLLALFLFLSVLALMGSLSSPGVGHLLERADRRLSRQHSQQSLSHSQAQSVSSLTSDLWDRSSNETPGILTPFIFNTQTQTAGRRHKRTLTCLCEVFSCVCFHVFSSVSDPQIN